MCANHSQPTTKSDTCVDPLRQLVKDILLLDERGVFDLAVGYAWQAVRVFQDSPEGWRLRISHEGTCPLAQQLAKLTGVDGRQIQNVLDQEDGEARLSVIAAFFRAAADRVERGLR